MAKDPNFSHETVDSRGFKAPTHMIGQVYQHQGNGHKYMILGVAWEGSCDEWAVVHQRAGSVVLCTRTYTNFFGVMSNGRARYIPVSSL